MIATPIAVITGLGTAVPDRVVPNAEFEKYLETSDEWIRERTGIRERRIAGPGETLSGLCYTASQRALTRAGVSPEDLDSIILGTITPDRRLPSTACELQARLGARHASAFDIAAACPGWIYTLALAEGLIASRQANTVLTIGAEKLSAVTDWEDRSTAVLFGDGAGAAIVQPATGDGRGILSIVIGADGKLADLLCIPGGGSSEPVSHQVIDERRQFIKMAGREVFKAAVHTMAKACEQALTKAGVCSQDIDLLIPHQANLRIIEATSKHAQVPMSKVMVNVDRYGNTSAASIQLAIDQAIEEGRIKPGSLLLLVTFGAGFTWGAAVVRW
ncbi:MAG: beta-ketoacyl-ACP synthase III [Gemmatimonadales bacterium]